MRPGWGMDGLISSVTRGSTPTSSRGGWRINWWPARPRTPYGWTFAMSGRAGTGIPRSGTRSRPAGRVVRDDRGQRAGSFGLQARVGVGPEVQEASDPAARRRRGRASVPAVVAAVPRFQRWFRGRAGAAARSISIRWQPGVGAAGSAGSAGGGRAGTAPGRPGERPRIQQDIEELRRRIAEQERLVADPEAATRRTRSGSPPGWSRSGSPSGRRLLRPGEVCEPAADGRAELFSGPARGIRADRASSCGPRTSG